MVAFLNASYALRRLAALTFVFIACIVILRQTSSSYNEYLPSWTPSQLYSPDSPDQDFYSLPEPGSSEEHLRPEDVVTKPEDILPQLQDIPPELGGPDSSNGEAPNSSPRSRISLEMQEYLSWDPPVEITAHYPPYKDYRNRDYDPNRWESFEQNNGFYVNGTTRKLHISAQQPTIYEVYPAYNSAEWLEKWRGEFVSCRGPTGVPYNTSTDGFVTAYDGVPVGFPEPDAGSYDAVGLDGKVCFERVSRLGPYGFNDDSIEFGEVKWGALQNECLERNSARYKLSNAPVLAPGLSESSTSQSSSEELAHSVKPRAGEESLQYQSRTAVLIRTWDAYEYQENDLQAVRSLISELSLQSGGEYHVFLFVNIKDSNLPIFTDPAAYQKALEDHVPEELRDIAILWTEKVCMEWYPEVGEWSVYWQQFMPLQWFAQNHPEFDYVWNWEMDARYIGHHYHFLEEIASFARQQPRKYLWERNSRYYFPAAHGTYDEFVRNTHEIVSKSSHVKTVWGAQPWSKTQKTSGPKPPKSEASDDFEWGVDEEADFITLLPMWDPRETWWAYRDKLWNYPASEASTEDRPYPDVPRRTFINTLTRFSSKLLVAMHEENKLGMSMASEMWPSSIALQHGLKAVYAPHPIWLSHHWPAEYLDQVFNADGWGAGSLPGTDIDHGRGVAYDAKREQQGKLQTGTGPNGEGRAGRWSQERDSVYSPDREHNFGGWSWYFWSDFPKTLYWRWLGWQSSFNIVTIEGEQSTDALKDQNWGEWENQNGHMCLPGMLLHPVKNVKEPPKPAEPEEDGDEDYKDAEEENKSTTAPADTPSSDTTSSENNAADTTASSQDPSADDSASNNVAASKEAASVDTVQADTDKSSEPTLSPQVEPQADEPQQYDSPFHDSPLGDNTLLEDARLEDLPVPHHPPSSHASSPLDDNTLLEDSRLEDIPVEVTQSQGFPPQSESANLETFPVIVDVDHTADSTTANQLTDDTTTTTPSDEETDTDTRPHELPPHAEFAYGGINAPAVAEAGAVVEASTFDEPTTTEDLFAPIPVVATADTPALAEDDDITITYDKEDSFDHTVLPATEPPVPGTASAPGYEDLFGDSHAATAPVPDAGIEVETEKEVEVPRTGYTDLGGGAAVVDGKEDGEAGNIA